MEPLLEIKNFSVTFRQYERGWNRRVFTAVEDLSFSLSAGEVVAVVGASGSGKSLLAHGILGILPYNAAGKGTLLYRGAELTQKRMEALRGREIVLIPQSVSFLDPLMKVGKQILKGRREPKARRRMEELLAQYHLSEGVAEKYPFELSGGMLRRVFLTMAQMERPKLVIADEPTPGLQKELAAQALSHLQELADEGAGVLLITHDLEQALVAADRIVVFYKGRSVEEVRAEDFEQVENLTHPYTKALFWAMPRHGFLCPGEKAGAGGARLKKGSEKAGYGDMPKNSGGLSQSSQVRKNSGGLSQSSQMRKISGSPSQSEQSCKTESTSTLEARNLTFRYGKNQRDVLKGVHLKVRGGELVGLTAPSGYGKTTLCKLLAGYEKPLAGEILLDGKPLKLQKGPCPVQMLWQHGIQAVNPGMKMKEILREGGKVQDEILEGLEIQESWMNRFPAELSGGELQRFCIARALGPETRFLLADEMTAMLDLVLQCKIWRFLVREVRKRGLGILVVSHNTDLLEQICDRIEKWDYPLQQESGGARTWSEKQREGERGWKFRKF